MHNTTTHPISCWWSIIASCQAFASLTSYNKNVNFKKFAYKIFVTTCAHKSGELSVFCKIKT